MLARGCSGQCWFIDLFAELHHLTAWMVASLSLAFHPQKGPAPRSALKTSCSESMLSNLSGGCSQKRLSTAQHKTAAHPASSKTRSASPLPEATVKPPEHQDPCGSAPGLALAPVSDQTLSGSSEEMSLAPPPPPSPSLLPASPPRSNIVCSPG